MDLENFKTIPKNLKFEDLIIFQNNNYLIINKPPFISSLSERNPESKINILALAKEYNPDLQLCHRIDKETSGILVLAKNPEAYRHLAMQFEHREVKKEYHALACSPENFNERIVDYPILKKKDSTAARIDLKKGSPAQTIFHTIKSYANQSLIRCIPITGRLHQIRVHLQYVKAPIVADLQYGGVHLYLSDLKKKFNLKKNHEEIPLIKRIALHAYGISFFDLDGSLITQVAQYPKDLEVAIAQLEKYS